MGRAFHQLNILYAAIHFYQKVLETPPLLKARCASIGWHLDPDSALHLLKPRKFRQCVIEGKTFLNEETAT